MPPISTDNPKGWYPQADRIGVPLANFAAGNVGRKAVVIHIMQGHMLGTIAYFTDPARQVSAHFAVDTQGNVKQFVSIIDTAFANGLSWSVPRKCWIDPEGAALKPPYEPTWTGLTPPINPNLYTISIEREGYTTDTPTPAMERATADIMRWLAQQFSAFRPYIVGGNLIGHSDISPKNRALCPGPHANLPGLAALANAVPSTPRYTVRHPAPVSETPTPNGPVALGGTAEVYRGDVLEIDEVKAGWAHRKDGLGFLPIMCLVGPL